MKILFFNVLIFISCQNFVYFYFFLGEAIEKMLQEKKISSKINYEVLKSLNISLNTTTKEPQKVEEPVQSSNTELNSTASSSKMSV